MTFLYPSFLFGLFALAIPVIIHLFNFRRTKKIYFSNTLFLKKVKEASSSKLKLKHYLVLASRLLFVFFLVMAFAQPFIPSKEDLTSTSRNIIYLDNSWSMSNEVDEDLPALNEASRYIEKLLEIYPEDAEYKVITNDFEPFSNTFKSKVETSDYLTELRFSGSSRTSGEILNRIMNETEGVNADIYWISDFQQTMFEDEMPRFDSARNVNLIPLYFTSVNNVYIDSVYLDNPFLVGDTKPKLNVIIENGGTEEVRDLVVKVLLEETEVATGSATILPGDQALITFDLAFDLQGINRGRIVFEEFPVTFDNDFYFTLNAGRKINILEIKGTNRKTHVENVYGNTNLFNFQSFNIANLDYGLIEKADLVVLNGIQSLDVSLTSPLNAYLENFGNLLIIPTYRPDVNSYRQVNGLGRVSAVDTARRVALAAPDFDNPFFQNVFEENNAGIAMPLATNTIAWGSDRTALLRSQSGVPYLSEIDRGGKIYLVGAPFDLDFSTFQNHALFVPVMYRMAVMSSRSDNRLYYFIDEEYISMPVDRAIGDEVARLERDEEELIPSQRVIGNDLLVEVPKYLLSAGFYNVTLAGDNLTSLAFNYSPEESNLEQPPTEYLQDVFGGNIDIFDTDSAEEFEGAIENKYIGTPLWKYAILLALVFLLAEVLLLRFLP